MTGPVVDPQRRTYATALGVMVFAVLLGLAGVLLGAVGSTAPPAGVVAIGAVLFVALVAAVIGGFVVAVRSGSDWLEPDPLTRLDRASRRRIVRAVNRNEHLDGDDERLAVTSAGRRKQQVGITGFLAVTQSLTLGLQLLDGRSALDVFLICIDALIVVLFALTVRAYRQGQVFLRSSPLREVAS